jgi:rhodanese-related sulfurtransferase
MKKRLIIGALFIFSMAGILTTFARSAEAPRMTKEELKAMLDSPNLIVIDVRTQQSWKEDDLKIKGTVREDPEAVESWANKYPKDKTLVFYCS